MVKVADEALCEGPVVHALVGVGSFLILWFELAVAIEDVDAIGEITVD